MDFFDEDELAYDAQPLLDDRNDHHAVDLARRRYGIDDPVDRDPIDGDVVAGERRADDHRLLIDDCANAHPAGLDRLCVDAEGFLHELKRGRSRPIGRSFGHHEGIVTKQTQTDDSIETLQNTGRRAPLFETNAAAASPELVMYLTGR